jgi:hypothetical protein
MKEGFQMRQEYDEMLHLETLRLLRYNAYMNYIAIPTKKGFRKVKLEKLYPLPNDIKPKVLSKDEMITFYNELNSLITNGKLRGYYNDEGEVFDKETKTTIIGHLIDGELQYLN